MIPPERNARLPRGRRASPHQEGACHLLGGRSHSASAVPFEVMLHHGDGPGVAALVSAEVEFGTSTMASSQPSLAWSPKRYRSRSKQPLILA